MTEYRIIESQAEREQYQRLAGYCFTLPYDRTGRIFPLPEPESLAWGAFEEGGLKAGIIVRRFNAVLFGRDFPAAGIAWVASAPEARNGGLVRTLMERALRHEHARGTVLAALYPFSFRFYGSFGFGSLGPRLEYRFAPETLRRVSVSGGLAAGDPADERDYADLKLLCRTRTEGFDFGITDLPAAARLSADMSAEEERLYLYRNGSGDPRGAISFRFEAGGGEPVMRVTRFLWSGGEGFRALCEFIRVHRGQCSAVILTLPPFTPLPFAAEEPRLSARIDHSWMARPLQIEPLLAARSAAEGGADEGIIEISDPLIAGNDGRYRYGGGEARREGPSADGGLPLQLFSSLLFGAVTRADAGTAVGSDLGNAGGLFDSKRRIWLTEEF